MPGCRVPMFLPKCRVGRPCMKWTIQSYSQAWQQVLLGAGRYSLSRGDRSCNRRLPGGSGERSRRMASGCRRGPVGVRPSSERACGGALRLFPRRRRSMLQAVGVRRSLGSARGRPPTGVGSAALRLLSPPVGRRALGTCMPCAALASKTGGRQATSAHGKCGVVAVLHSKPSRTVPARWCRPSSPMSPMSSAC